MVAAVEIEAGRATGIRLSDGTVIHADRIVLAAGTYGSPTILMRSGIGPGDPLRDLGIPVEVDLPGVGSNLADHPAVELDTGWRGVVATGPSMNSIAPFRSGGRTANSAPDLMFWVGDPIGDEAAFTIETVLLKPAARGSVRLRSADHSDLPRITLPSLDESADVDRLIESIRSAFEIARRPELRQFVGDALPAEPRTAKAWRQFFAANAYSIPHVVGTCAMGPAADRDAVVDARGSVHGIEGLSVIDASIIPDAPAGFPHLITIMLAEQLSEQLLGAP
jgi:choline dehydrogenase